VYGSYQELVAKEAALPADQRIDFVAIVTPNHVHFPAAKAALEAGFHVLIDKPATLDLADAKELAPIVKKTGRLYGLTHNYTGYPLVKEARHLVHSGKLGKIRKVVVEYPQGWLATRLEASGQKQAAWRTELRPGWTLEADLRYRRTDMDAGPEAVKGWLRPGWQATPELWVEAIPYPETRLYVKKVLGNAWSYQQPRQPRC
jgi:hypothetical protein